MKHYVVTVALIRVDHKKKREERKLRSVHLEAVNKETAVGAALDEARREAPLFNIENWVVIQLT
jgi:hypothetical protein